MSYRVYVCGFSDNDLSPDEETIIDSSKDKWKDKWSKEAFNPVDKRSSDFNAVTETFESEVKRDDGKKIVVFADFEIDKDAESTKVLELVKDLAQQMSNITFQAYGDDGAPM